MIKYLIAWLILALGIASFFAIGSWPLYRLATRGISVQGAAIEFYTSLQNEDCYVETLGFKSYAHFFYKQTKESNTINNAGNEWLLNGTLDKPAYFVCKINNAEEYLKSYPQLKEIYKKNGFVFLVRKPRFR